MIKETIAKLVKKIDLSETEASGVMSEIMSGEATEAQIASFITALRMKGETVEEITGSARVMREFATRIKVKSAIDIDTEDINIDQETIFDNCGTGGDSTNTFNVSTAAALIIAGAGLTVAKHGNRSVSSSCGSADVLEELGVNLDISPEKVEECISKIGIGFLFAPALHGAMKYAIGPRKQIGIRTIFNILGPLTNPAGANSQVLGVYSRELVEKMANVLKNLGVRKAWVVHSEDGMDELSVSAPTFVCELDGGKLRQFSVKPEDFNIKRAKLSDIRGGNAKENAAIISKILEGEKGARRDAAVLNAGAGLYIGQKAKDVQGGIKLAEEAIDSGKAKGKLKELIKITNE
jgi:anthranilate phosphoribosyltransferase